MVDYHRGTALHFLPGPTRNGIPAHQYHEDALLIIEDGKIRAFGPAKKLLGKVPKTARIHRHLNALLLPGFVDCHVHFPQIDMIGSYGKQLLDWLRDHAYPAEERFRIKAHAAKAADFFLQELLRNG